VFLECVGYPGVASGLAGPAPLVGVGSELVDVGELGAQSRNELGPGNEVVAGLADVGVGAGLSGQVRRAVAGGDPGLQVLRRQPLDLCRHRWSAGGNDGDAAADLADGLVVGGAQRWRGTRRVAEGHLGGDVPEEGHEPVQAHPGVSQLGGVGVAELVGCDPERGAARAGEAGCCHGGVESPSDPPCRDALAALGEEVVARGSAARIGMGALATPSGRPGVEEGDGVCVEGHGAFGVELAERDALPGAGGPVVDDAVELQIEQLPETQSRSAKQRETDTREVIVEAADRLHEGLVDVRGHAARQWPGQAGNVGREDQPALGALRPSPRGDPTR